MKILSRFAFDSKDETIAVVRELIDLFNIHVTNATIKNDLLSHPDYPSLLSISDVLIGYGIENISFVSTQDKLTETPTPFIAQIKDENQQDALTIITNVTPDRIFYYQVNQHRWKSISRPEFHKKWPSGSIISRLRK